MYIKRLESWEEKRWKKYFLQFPKIKTDQEKQEIKQALTLSSKEAVESFFPLFRKYGIINGIGPGYMGAFFRGIISFLFRSVKYEYHDIEYGIGGTEKDRVRADYGLLKYSILNIIKNYKKVLLLDFSPLAIIFIFLGVFIGSIIQLAIILFCFTMVLIFGRFGSFRFLQNENGRVEKYTRL